MRDDTELVAVVVLLVQLDGDLVEDGRRDVVHGARLTATCHLEQPDGHQRADSAHLALVLVMVPIPVVGRDGAVRLLFDLTHPVLRQPGVTDIVEQVRDLQAGLVAVTDVALAMASEETCWLRPPERVVELVGVRCLTAHQIGQPHHVMRGEPGRLPRVGLDEST